MTCNKTVVVTGGSRGIGSEICRLFAQNNYNVVCLYQKSDDLAFSLEQEFSNIKTYKCDVSNYEEVFKTCQNILKLYSKIDVLINNAGIAIWGLFTDSTVEDFDKCFDVNVKGVYNVTHCLIKSMISNQSGSIINISSIWGEVGASMEVLYSASKGAIISFTKSLAKEMGLSNIRVNCISPGIIKTDMIQDIDADVIHSLVDETPLNRVGTTQDIANAALFLASENASFITGQVLSVNGGFVI